jgi:hypothetical protein
LAALFLVALVGVLVAGGLVAAQVGGALALAGYTGVVLALLALAAVRLRRLAPGASQQPHCTCCDGDHLAPVRVV